MAQTMKNVKAISIPVNGTSYNVKKIEDSNGNIIWGSLTAFPYRRLEYIHLNGAERVQTNFYAGTTTINHQSEFTLDEMPTSGNEFHYVGIYDNTISNGLKRLYLAHVNTTGLHINIGNTWSDYASSLPLNTKLKLSGTLGKDGSNKPRIYYYLFNQDAGTTILTAAPLVGPEAGDLNTTVVLSIGCVREHQSTTDNYNKFWKGKVYNYQRRQTNASGTLLTNLIPCQRKSDGVCGMYDTVGNTFYQMRGTTITDAAAGPVVDEYWDLTA